MPVNDSTKSHKQTTPDPRPYDHLLLKPEDREYTAESLLILLKDYFMFHPGPIDGKVPDALSRIMALVQALTIPPEAEA